VPYLVSHGWQAAETGTPLMRPMVMEFPDDPASHAFDLQYCLGRELLVSPVVTDDGWVTTYLPPGRWLDWWSGAVVEGARTLRRQVPLRELPLYLRKNSLLVLGPVRQHVAERPADPLTVEAFVTTEAAFAFRTDAGRIDFQCRRDGERVTLDARGADTTLILRLRDTDVPRRVTAGGQALPRVDPGQLERADGAWGIEGRTLVVKARARELRIE
jgi:alpha-D-xyloside xylohydrolase